jgi:hypothetical protein
MSELEERLEAIGEQLQAKIRSKFQTTTFLAGFAITLLGTQIARLWQPKEIPQLLPVSISVMLVAVALYIYAIVKLDELTMPKRFWEEEKKDDGVHEGPNFWYLSNEDLWELRNRMIFYWNRLTLAATLLTMISLFLMLLPLPSKELSTESGNRTALLRETFTYTLILLSLMIAYLAILSSQAKKRFKPLVRGQD